MVMKIIKADDVKVENIIIVVYGQPNVGKTTFGLSANKPILLDTDGGVHRAMNRSGKDVVQVNGWDSIRHMTAEDFAKYETIIIDTVGKVLTYLSLDLIEGNPKYGNISSGLNMHGYGALKIRFTRWFEMLRSLKKDIVLIAHATEETKKDETVVRISAVGSSKQEIYQQADLMGYMYMDNDQRVINFNPSETAFGKNVGLPAYKLKSPDKDPSIMATIIKNAKFIMNEQAADQAKQAEVPKQPKVEVATKPKRTTYRDYTTVGEFNKIVGKFLKLDDDNKHVVLETSEKLGITFDEATGAFVKITDDQSEEIKEEYPEEIPF